MSRTNKISRRDLLGGLSALGISALFPTPVERLLGLMSQSFISEAQAQTFQPSGVRNYVNILLPGGPLRYVFDSWIQTKTGESIFSNPMVSTALVSSGGKIIPTYKTFDYKGTLVPHMFSHTVFDRNGAQIPLTRLLDNMLVIRGFATNFDGHPFNASIQQMPVGGIASINGLVADNSRQAFESIEYVPRYDSGKFNSLKGKALNVLPKGTPLNSLLEGFSVPAENQMKGRDLASRNQDAFALARAKLLAHANSGYLGSAAMASNLSNAVALMKKGTGDIDLFWGPAVNRYKNVIEKSMQQSGLVGLSDVPLISDKSSSWNVGVTDGSGVLTIDAEFDFRSSVSSLVDDTQMLSEGLALTEYVLKNDLVSSVNILGGQFTGLTLKNSLNQTTGLHTGHLDMHETGAVAAVLITTAYFRGLSAGLLELIDQLKKSPSKLGGDAWSQTVIQVIGDFNRSPRSNGSGADHGFNQMVTSVFSGAFTNGPFVVGNISKNGINSNYSGTIGLAAPISGFNQSGNPSPVMAASTVAALLNIEKNPYQNLAEPLVSLINGKIATKFNSIIVD